MKQLKKSEDNLVYACIKGLLLGAIEGAAMCAPAVVSDFVLRKMGASMKTRQVINSVAMVGACFGYYILPEIIEERKLTKWLKQKKKRIKT